MGRIFVCHQCFSKRCIDGYVAIARVLMADKKASKDGCVSFQVPKAYGAGNTTP
ncbi:hypothetical protein BMETH_1501_0 [methanotrophic bacterial endosymbiont of Bathymodiolus sp.]|nr:hypothetical protein BMETH_1501_0 [methanotrophic bacterial endosymbiont of Bathymodiolus sp.]